MFGERLGIEKAKDFFSFKIWLRCFGGDNADSGLFAEWNFNNVANLKWFDGCVSKSIVAIMKGFGGRDKVVIHNVILTR